MEKIKVIVDKLISSIRDKCQKTTITTQTPNLKLLKKIRIFYCFLSFFILFVGMAVYLFFKESNMIRVLVIEVSEWIPFVNINIDNLPLKLKPSFFSNVLMYNVADMLWIVSGILFLRFIWFYNIKMQKIYIFCMYGIGLFLEISQLSENVLGTFDWYDILFISIGAFVESLLYNIFVRRRFV
jgi:hypothetical protein